MLPMWLLQSGYFLLLYVSYVHDVNGGWGSTRIGGPVGATKMWVGIYPSQTKWVSERSELTHVVLWKV